MTPQTANHNSILKDTREAKGLTLEIVHEATKIPLDALKAIEQGYSVRMLTPFYYKGFIKIYAEFLGLNVEEILKAYHLDRKPIVPVVASSTTPPKKQKEFKSKTTPAKSKTITLPTVNPKIFGLLAKAAAIVLILFVAFKLLFWLGSKIKFNKNNSSVKVEKLKDTAVSKDVPKEKLPFRLIKAESNNLKVNLAVRAVKDSWIQVKVDGKVVYAMSMKKGTMESWVGYNQIEISGKNINELDFEVNGKHLGPLGSGERWAKKAVINRQGLTVKK